MLAWKGLKKEWKLPDYRDRGYLIKIGFTQLRGQAGFIRVPPISAQTARGYEDGREARGERAEKARLQQGQKKSLAVRHPGS